MGRFVADRSWRLRRRVPGWIFLLVAVAFLAWVFLSVR